MSNKPAEYYYGYYFSLDSTGVPAVDGILEAVAKAARGCHHTRDWDEHGYPDAIQEAADSAAANVKRIEQQFNRLRRALVTVRSSLVAATADANYEWPALLEYVEAELAGVEP